MDVEQAKKILESGIPFVHRSGLRVLELARGRVRVCMPFAGNANHIGTLYAGALFTCAEIPGGALFLSSFDPARCYPVVKALNLRFLRPARSDVFLEIGLAEPELQRIQAELDAQGKAEFVLEGELKDADGLTVASSHGVYQLRRHPAAGG
jgi:acyl-coenzyme A thioesterase PaaI-like protein